MKLYALIHPCRAGWCFDLFAHISYLDSLLGRKPPTFERSYQPPCSRIKDWLVEHPKHRYLESGDMAHVDTVLNEWGLESDTDLAGLKKMLMAKGFTVKEAETR